MPAEDTITRLTLERWALGTLEPDQAEALERARQADPDLNARMVRIQESVQSAAVDLPRFTLPADEPEPVGWLDWLRNPRMLVGLAVLAVVMLAVVPSVLPGSGGAGGGEIVFRGDFELRVFRVRMGEAAEQGALIQALPGDRIQYDVTAAQDGYLAIYNLQDDGKLQAWMPSRAVAADEAVTAAVMLDDYTGSERIFFFIDTQPIEEEQVRGAVQRAFRSPLADLDTLPGASPHQRSVLVLKEGK